MDSKFISALVFCSLMVITSHADSRIKAYWKKVLGDTEIPNGVKESLPEYYDQAAAKQGRLFNPNNIGGWYKQHDEHIDIQRSLTFTEKSLRIGKEVTLYFPAQSIVPFFPRSVAESIPFSPTKLPQILNYFHENPESEFGEVVKQTLADCELKTLLKNEEYCATSLESMVDYVTFKLGKKVKAFSSMVPDEGSTKYNISGVILLEDKEPVLTCHKTFYPYKVFYCHVKRATTVYEVSLVSADEASAVKVLAVCHHEPESFKLVQSAAEVLNGKPGTPFCHFLDKHDVLWLRKY